MDALPLQNITDQGEHDRCRHRVDDKGKHALGPDELRLDALLAQKQGRRAGCCIGQIREHGTESDGRADDGDVDACVGVLCGDRRT